MARLDPRGFGKALTLSVIKRVNCTGIGWAVGLWFWLARVAFGALVLQCTIPVAVTSYPLAEKMGADSRSVAGLVMVSTLFAVGALPLLLALLL